MFGAFQAWNVEEDRRIQAEQDRDRALDHDRPEVFAGLEFGPGPRDGEESIYVHNRGLRDALNVQIHPITLIGKSEYEGEEIEITKEITFPKLSSIAKTEKYYPQFYLGGDLWDEMGELGKCLRSWCERWGRQEISFDLHVDWTDTSGNQFTSSSQVNYSLQGRKCRTVFGQVKRMGSSNT